MRGYHFYIHIGEFRASPMVCHLHLLSLVIWQKLQICFSSGLLKHLPNYEELLSRGETRANLRAVLDLPSREEARAAPSPAQPRKIPNSFPRVSIIVARHINRRAVRSPRRWDRVSPSCRGGHRRPVLLPPSSSARRPSVVVRVAVLRPRGLRPSSSARPPSLPSVKVCSWNWPTE